MDNKSLLMSEPPPPYEDAPGAPNVARRPPPGLPPPLNLPVLNTLRQGRIVLASASPRRRQLLAQIGLTKIDICPSTFAEDYSHELGPTSYVLQTAEAKAMEVYKREINNKERGEPTVVIAADTIIVSHAGRILEKPRGEQDHIKMLTMLRDDVEHKVMTAVVVMHPLESCVQPGYKIATHVEETTVKFDPTVPDETILAYIKTRDGNDKAGGYGIQSGGSILIERIEGTYDNVVGLPLRQLMKLIDKVMEPEENEDFGLFVEEEDEMED